MTTEAAQPLDAAATVSTGSEAQPERIHVNTDVLTIDDMVFLEEMNAGTLYTFRQLRDFFNHVVVNEDGTPADAGKRSRKDIARIINAIWDAIIEDGNPKGK